MIDGDLKANQNILAFNWAFHNVGLVFLVYLAVYKSIAVTDLKVYKMIL